MRNCALKFSAVYDLESGGKHFWRTQ